MDIVDYWNRINQKQQKEEENKKFQALQTKEINLSIENIKFTKILSIASLIISIISLFVAIFK